MNIDSYFESTPHRDNLEYLLCVRHFDGEIDKDSLLAAKQAEIERTEARLQRYLANPSIRGNVIDATMDRIEDLRQECIGLGGSGGEPPRRPSGYSSRPDDYAKERLKIRTYFRKAVRREVLKTPQDEMYAAMGVRLLNSMGKKLDNYEIHVPADYRLEILKRLGRQVKIFEGRDVTWYQPPETMEGGFVFRTDFLEDTAEHIKNRPGLSDAKEPFRDGFKRESDVYAPLWEFVFLRKHSKFPYIGTSKSKEVSEKVFPWKSRESFLYVINPRGLNGIDLENSPEAQYSNYEDAKRKGTLRAETKLREPEKTIERQREVTFIDGIDSRDIKGYFRVEWIKVGGNMVPKAKSTFVENPNYVPSHWELPGPYKL